MLLLLSLVTAAPGPVEAAETFAASSFRQQPAQVVFAASDLRATLEQSWKRIAKYREVKVLPSGPDELDRVFGFPWLRTNLEILRRASPTRKTAALVVSCAGGETAWCIATLGGTEAGALARLAKLEPVLGVSIRKAEAGYVLGYEEQVWLHLLELPDRILASTEPINVQPEFSYRFPESLKAHTQSALSFVHASMSPDLAAEVAAGMDEPTIETGLQALKHGLLTVGMTADTQWLKLVAESPQLFLVSSMVAGSARSPNAPALWGQDASALLELNLAPTLLPLGLSFIPNPPPALTVVQDRLDGRVSLATFYSMSDWSLALGAGSIEGAQAVVAALHELMDLLAPEQLKAMLGEDTPNFRMNLERGDLENHAFSIRPSPGEVGWMVSAQESWVVLGSQPKRTWGRSRSLRTDYTESLLKKPAIASATMLLGFDFAFYEMYRWVFAVFPQTEKTLFPELEGIWPMWNKYVERFPAMITIYRAYSFTLYDVTLSVDIDGNQLVIDGAVSEL